MVIVGLEVIAVHVVHSRETLTGDGMFAHRGNLLRIEKLLRRPDRAATDPGLLGRQLGQRQVKSRHALDDALEAGITDRPDKRQIALVMAPGHPYPVVLLDGLLAGLDGHDGRHIVDWDFGPGVVHQVADALHGLDDGGLLVGLDIDPTL